MSKLRLLIVALSMSLWGYYGYAQDRSTRSLSIDDVFELLEQNNSDISVSRMAVDVARQGESEAKASRLPDVSLSLRLSYLGDATLLDRDFSNIMRADMPHFGNNLAFNVYQPIYAGGAITGAVNLAKANTEMADVALDETRNGVKMQAVGCYLNLFKFRNLLNVYNENIQLTEQLLKNMEAKKEQGIVLKNDITRYELRLSTLKYDRVAVKNNIDVLNHDLVSLLGLPQTTEIVPDSTLLDETLPIDGISYWKAISVDNSNSLKLIDAEKEIALQSDKIIRAERLPHIGLVAGNNFDGPIVIEVPPIDKNINYWWVGVNISYNFSSLFKSNKKIEKSRLKLAQISEKRLAATDALDIKVQDAYTSYTQAFEMLATQQKNVELAEQNYQVINNRYNNQLALLTDMIDASTAKLDAEVRLVNAKINTLYYYYTLKFISGTL